MATQNTSDEHHYSDEDQIIGTGNGSDEDKSEMSAELEQVAEMVANTIIQKAVASLTDDMRKNNSEASSQDNNNKEMDLLDVSYSESFEASSEARTISEEEIEANQSGGSEEDQLPYNANGLDFSGDLTDSTHDGQQSEGHPDHVIPLIRVSDDQEVLSAQPDIQLVKQDQKTLAQINGDLNRSDNSQNISDDSTEALNNPVGQLEAIENTIKVNGLYSIYIQLRPH